MAWVESWIQDRTRLWAESSVCLAFRGWTLRLRHFLLRTLAFSKCGLNPGVLWGACKVKTVACLFGLLRQDVICIESLTWNLLCGSGWLWICEFTVSTSWLLRLQVCNTTSGKIVFNNTVTPVASSLSWCSQGHCKHNSGQLRVIEISPGP